MEQAVYNNDFIAFFNPLKSYDYYIYQRRQYSETLQSAHEVHLPVSYNYQDKTRLFLLNAMNRLVSKRQQVLTLTQ